MRRPDRETVARVLIVVGLLSLAVGSAGAVGAGGFDTPFQTGDVDPDTVVLRADVAENGTAAWTIEYRVRLDDDNTTAAFESLASDIRANQSDYEAQFRSRMTKTAGVAENATGRSMAIENVSVVAERRQLPQEYGVVSYKFRWTNFAAVENDRLLIGDALSGFFLDEETSLVISWPNGYEVSRVTPPAEERGETSVVWRGPTDFGTNEPRIELVPSGGFPTGAVGAAVLVFLLVGAAAWYRRRGAATTDEVAGGKEVNEGGASETATEEVGGEPSDPPEDLLSPEERVLKFVEERGGRVKQQDVVSTFDWTAARTSQVVGNLRDEGKIETFRLGRENVLTLPDDEDDEEFGDPAPNP